MQNMAGPIIPLSNLTHSLRLFSSVSAFILVPMICHGLVLFEKRVLWLRSLGRSRKLFSCLRGKFGMMTNKQPTNLVNQEQACSLPVRRLSFAMQWMVCSGKNDGNDDDVGDDGYSNL